MISQEELFRIKSRLLTAADAAYRLLNTAEPVVRFDEREYWQVHEAFSLLAADLGVVLSELDTLRSLFADRVQEFFQSEGVVNEIPINTDAMAGVPDAQDQRGGGEARDDSPVPSEPAPARGVRRRRTKGAKPRTDTSGVQAASAQVDAGAEGKSVGGTSEN